MAIENHVILNGQIQKLVAGKSAVTGEVKQISIALMVLRRPGKNQQLRFDTIPILVRDPVQIKYILDGKIRKGDFLEVSGTFNNKHNTKKFFCEKCGYQNTYDGTTSYVTPLCLEPKVLKPKESEIIWLSNDECSDFDEIKRSNDIMKIINEKKHSEGVTIDYEMVNRTDYGMNIRVYSQKETTFDDAREWMSHMSDISNRIYIIGNLCGDPAYFRDEEKNSKAAVATYQLGVDRKIFVKEDDPDLRSDYPYIKSIGDQADMDKDTLIQGSLVFIDGALQARDNFKVKKECVSCGAVNEVQSSTLEIVPYSVEYLRNCKSPNEEDNVTVDDETLDFEEMNGDEKIHT